MKMRIQGFTSLIFLLLVTFSINIQAGPLTGKTIGATNSTGAILPSSNAAVGAGVEFTSLQFSGFDFFSADLTEDGLLTITDILPGGLGHGASQIVSFFDVFADIADIVGATLATISGVTGITPSDISFNANSVTIQLGTGTNWSQGDKFSVQLTFSQVPEPATLSLIGLGLAGIRLSQRKQLTKTPV